MRKIALGLIVCVPLLFAGCPTTELQPLYNATDDVSEPALVGKWTDEASDKGYVQFDKSTDHDYLMTISDPDEGSTDVYDAHLVRLGGNLFADLRFSKRTTAGKEEDIPLGTISAHMIAKLKITGDQLAWSSMEDEPLEKISATDKAAPAYIDYSPDGDLVTADTAVLRQYVTAHANDGFSDPDHLHRIH